MKRVTLILIFLALVVASYAQEKGGSAETEVSGSYSQAFGRSVTVSDDYVTAFYDTAYPGKVGVNNANPHSTLHYDGSEASAINNDTSMDDDDHTLFVSGGSAVTIPDAADCPGRIYYIRNTDDSNTSTITPSSGDIEGGINYTLAVDAGIIIQNDGTDWWIIADYNLP